MTYSNLEQLVEKVAKFLMQRQWLVCSAESCTGGWIAQSLTEQAGSSKWFDCGFVTYSNESKHEMLGVPEWVLKRHGAVSHQTVDAMLQGALSHSRAHVAVAVSGIAGPSGGTDEKPIGTVYIGWLVKNQQSIVKLYHFAQNNAIRSQIRLDSVTTALEGILNL